MQLKSDLNYRLPCFCSPFLNNARIVFSFEIILVTIACFYWELRTCNSEDTMFLSLS